MDEYWQCIDRYNDYEDILACMLSRTTEGIKTSVQEFFSSSVNAMLDSLGASISSLIISIGETLSKLVDGVIETVNVVIDSIAGTMKVVVDNVIEYASDVYEKVNKFIQSLVSGASKYVTELLITIDKTIKKVMNSVTFVLKEVSDFVDNATSRFMGFVSNSLNKINDVAQEIIASAADTILDISDKVFAGVSGFVDAGIMIVKESFASLESTIIEIIEDPVAFVDSALESASEFLDTLKLEGEKFLKDLNEEIMPPIIALMKLATFSSDSEGDTVIEKIESGMQDILTDYYEIMKDPKLNLESVMIKMLESSGFLGIPAKAFTAVIILIINGMMIIPTAMSIGSAKTTQAIYSVMTEYPVTAYTNSEAVSLAARGFISKQEAAENNLKTGYSSDKTENLIKSAKNRLDPERLMVLLRRGDLTEEDFKDRLATLGYTDKAATSILALRELIPPPQDLITMSVREAFSPNIISEFQTAEGLPQDFVLWMEKQGYSPEWSEKFWIAHWRLPSLTQGFEMFHRGVINDEQVDMLLKAQDVSPFWRQKLKKIAYNPVTRVDVRRMYKLGVIDVDEVDERYRALGYSPPDAEIMTKFTIAYAEGSSADSEVNTRTQSLKQIKRLWSIGTIPNHEAIELLEISGYSKDLTALMVKSWEDEEEYAIREQLIGSVISRAVKDNLSPQEMSRLVSNMGFSSGEIDRITRLVNIARLVKTATPTKAELTRMALDNIISVAEWSEQMSSRGYSSSWIDKYKQLYKLG